MENDINPLRTYLESNYHKETTNHANMILLRTYLNSNYLKRMFVEGSK